MSKYYTPEIEEFHVGFEYERGNNATKNTSTKWYKEEIVLTQDIVDLFCCEEIRVKYLHKEDIESLGFILKDVISKDRNIYQNKKDNFLRLSCTYKKEIPYISIYHYEGWETPDFIIKNKSELKKLLKQLNILDE